MKLRQATVPERGPISEGIERLCALIIKEKELVSGFFEPAQIVTGDNKNRPSFSGFSTVGS